MRKLYLEFARRGGVWMTDIGKLAGLFNYSLIISHAMRAGRAAETHPPQTDTQTTLDLTLILVDNERRIKLGENLTYTRGEAPRNQRHRVWTESDAERPTKKLSRERAFPFPLSICVTPDKVGTLKITIASYPRI